MYKCSRLYISAHLRHFNTKLTNFLIIIENLQYLTLKITEQTEKLTFNRAYSKDHPTVATQQSFLLIFDIVSLWQLSDGFRFSWPIKIKNFVKWQWQGALHSQIIKYMFKYVFGLKFFIPVWFFFTCMSSICNKNLKC